MHNIFASCDVKFPIKLEKIAQFDGEFALYEPELFPGLALSHEAAKSRATHICFGEDCDHGSKKRDDTYEAFKNIYPVLSSSRRNVVQRVED